MRIKDVEVVKLSDEEKAEKVFYRHKFGHWISPKNYGSAARSILSLPPGNTAANTSTFIISEGSKVLSGKAAALFGQTGGGIQWWIGLL